jgi:hypothetical protein
MSWLRGSSSQQVRPQQQQSETPSDATPRYSEENNRCDQLTVSTGLVGLIADIIQTTNDVIDLDAPMLSPTAKCLQSLKLTVILWYKALRQLETGVLPHSERAAYIQLDVLIATLAECILATSEVGTLLVDIVVEVSALEIGVDQTCQRYGKPLRHLGRRLAHGEGILSKMLSVLQV